MLLAAVGAFSLIGDPLLRMLFASSSATDIVREVASPDGLASARVKITSGGLGTVHTVHVELSSHEGEKWAIYQAGDSDYRPSLRWIDRQTLELGLPCERFDFASNPDDWKRSASKARQLKVRFRYDDACSDR
ncbi:hypothetical protein ACFOMD_14110 [Sphingoaurantiacus capsulatus]|uniref:Uncharacterized protein n=1 Tax=Sphingoaurantiacus capsulatus TaxID=1771310 RepID=A0ABV7XEK8_9SPHN